MRFASMLMMMVALASCGVGGGSGSSGNCLDGILDPNTETDIDCGGFCGPCAGGLRCEAPTDCTSADCVAGVCAMNAASCTDGRVNGVETDVDCGGAVCPGCAATRACLLPTDCKSGECTEGHCGIPATCSDAQLTPGESDLDCGGPCLPCGTGKSCREHVECLSATCVFGVCKEPSCTDGVLNQGEANIDCGGPCEPCPLGANCNQPADCLSGACEGGTCCEANACGFCGASPTDVCDGLDNDCDGQTDEGLRDQCGACGPQLVELCDGLDNDCNGQTDEAPSCAPCRAAPIAITDSAFPKQTKSSEWSGSAYALGSGRMCGHFQSAGTNGDDVRTNRAIFYCVDGASPTVFHHVESSRTATGHDRVVAWSGPLGEDVVYVIEDTDYDNDYVGTRELYRVTTSGSVTNVSGAFPNLGDDYRHAMASSGAAVFALAFPSEYGSNGAMTLTTYPASGSATSQTIAVTAFDEAAVAVGQGPAAKPVAYYREGSAQGAGSALHFWRDGGFFTTLPAQRALSYAAFAVDAAGTLHLADDPNEIAYARFSNGQWERFDVTTSSNNVYYPEIVLAADGAPWVIVHSGSPSDAFELYRVVEGQKDSKVSRRAYTGRGDRPTGVVSAADRLHVFFSDERGFWNNDVTPEVAATWGYYMQICPGISD